VRGTLHAKHQAGLPRRGGTDLKKALGLLSGCQTGYKSLASI
jgi:hypothetical protein